MLIIASEGNITLLLVFLHQKYLEFLQESLNDLSTHFKKGEVTHYEVSSSPLQLDDSKAILTLGLMRLLFFEKLHKSILIHA